MKTEQLPDMIEIVWHIEDILHTYNADRQREFMSRHEARLVLQALKNHHDAERGVTWNEIDHRIETMLENGKIKCKEKERC